MQEAVNDGSGRWHITQQLAPFFQRRLLVMMVALFS